MSHDSDSDSLPGHPESFGRPPLHARVLDLIPDPHVTEHDDHSPKSAHAINTNLNFAQILLILSEVTYLSGRLVCHEPKRNLFPKLKQVFYHRMFLRLLIQILLVG